MSTTSPPTVGRCRPRVIGGVAIAYSPVDKQFGYAHSPTEEIAVTAALHTCGEVTGFCTWATVAKKGNCVALATRGIGKQYNGGGGRDRGRAMAAASSRCTAARSSSRTVSERPHRPVIPMP
jgi:hypothetical protein